MSPGVSAGEVQARSTGGNRRVDVAFAFTRRYHEHEDDVAVGACGKTPDFPWAKPGGAQFTHGGGSCVDASQEIASLRWGQSAAG